MIVKFHESGYVETICPGCKKEGYTTNETYMNRGTLCYTCHSQVHPNPSMNTTEQQKLLFDIFSRAKAVFNTYV